MTVKFEVTHDGYLIRYTIADPLDMNELMQAYTHEQAHRDSVPHVVHSLNDFSNMRRVPKNWLSARSGPGLKHPRAGEMIFVGLAPGLKILVETIMRITRFKRVKLFDNMADAEAYVEELLTRTRTTTPEADTAETAK